MPVRAPKVVRDASFDHDVNALSADFPDVDASVNVFVGELRLGYDIPEILIEPDGGVYTAFLDYPPYKADGKHLFQVTYHATETCVVNPMKDPPCTYTLLTIWNVHNTEANDH